MRVFLAAILTTAVLALTASAALYGEPKAWFSTTENQGIPAEERARERIAEEVASTDEPLWWIPFTVGAVVLGSGFAGVLLTRSARKKAWVPRSEDEAWAAFLGVPKAEL